MPPEAAALAAATADAAGDGSDAGAANGWGGEEASPRKRQRVSRGSPSRRPPWHVAAGGARGVLRVVEEAGAVLLGAAASGRSGHRVAARPRRRCRGSPSVP